MPRHRARQIARIDSDGHPYIVDQLKNLIKYKDFQVILRRVLRDGATQRS